MKGYSNFSTKASYAKGIMIFFLFSLCITVFIYGNESQKDESEAYLFKGTHFLASYSGCNEEALTDLPSLSAAMLNAAQYCGATVLKSAEHVFPPDGFSMVILLSESHASIHTYPEYQSCFVDLFTCGNNCSFEKFDHALCEYLQPREINSRVLLRGQDIEEIGVAASTTKLN